MTHDDMIAIIQGHKDGKTIQYMSRVFKDWREVGHTHTFNFANEQYRIKPEPRVFALVKQNNGIYFAFDHISKATDWSRMNSNSGEVIRVKEIL